MLDLALKMFEFVMQMLNSVARPALVLAACSRGLRRTDLIRRRGVHRRFRVRFSLHPADLDALHERHCSGGSALHPLRQHLRNLPELLPDGAVSKNVNSVSKSEKLCIKDEEFCIENDDVCSEGGFPSQFECNGAGAVDFYKNLLTFALYWNETVFKNEGGM